MTKQLKNADKVYSSSDICMKEQSTIQKHSLKPQNTKALVHPTPNHIKILRQTSVPDNNKTHAHPLDEAF